MNKEVKVEVEGNQSDEEIVLKKAEIIDVLKMLEGAKRKLQARLK